MNHQVLEDLLYTKEHEWARIEGDIATVGITDFAQSSLGDIVFLELPPKGQNLTPGQAFGVVESIKSVSDLYAPFEGEVLEFNEDLVSSPEKCNEGPYDSWMIKIKLKSSDTPSGLLKAQEYEKYCQSL